MSHRKRIVILDSCREIAEDMAAVLESRGSVDVIDPDPSGGTSVPPFDIAMVAGELAAELLRRCTTQTEGAMCDEADVCSWRQSRRRILVLGEPPARLDKSQDLQILIMDRHPNPAQLVAAVEDVLLDRPIRRSSG